MATNAGADADADADRANAAAGEFRRTANDARKRNTILSAVQTRRWRRLINVGEGEGMLPVEIMMDDACSERAVSIESSQSNRVESNKSAA